MFINLNKGYNLLVPKEIRSELWDKRRNGELVFYCMEQIFYFICGTNILRALSPLREKER